MAPQTRSKIRHGSFQQKITTEKLKQWDHTAKNIERTAVEERELRRGSEGI